MSRPTRTAAAVCALTGVFFLGLAAPAAAGSVRAEQGGPASPAWVAITSISPRVATAHGDVTVSGQFKNLSSAVISGVSVHLRWSSQWLQSRSQLQMYADGLLLDEAVPGTGRQITGSIKPGAAARWSISVPVKELQLTRFGVYPLAAQADSAGAPLAISRTFLPYWPASNGGPRPDRLNISWILPLIDQPNQTACPGLLNNGLAASVGPGGRLNGLLAAGAAYASRAAITWAIDPALLSSVQTMSSGTGYRVGGNADCRQSRQLPASKAAAAWLAGVRKAARAQPVFITPYADVDIAALSRQSLEQDLSRAFRLGRSTATRILDRSFGTSAPGRSAPARGLPGFAWPADGIANYGVLQNLAVNGISTVILSSWVMPPLAKPRFTPSAVASTPNGETGDMHVLLSDSGLTQILSSADSPRQAPGKAFAVRQRFLAETAMIAAEAPTTPRAIVVAPPRRWDPPAGLAGSLLADTAAAPWLRPVPLGRLAAVTSSAGQVRRARPDTSSRAALSERLLRNVRTVGRRVQLLAGIDAPDAALRAAIASVESSAWRGGKAGRHAQALLDRVSDYVTSQLGGLSIIPSDPVTLGGLRGTVPVSVRSRLSYPVKVRLRVDPTGGRLTVSSAPGIITVPAGHVILAKIKVHATAIGSTGIELGLTTLGGRPLPGPPTRMTIQATQFGTLALIIVAAALGVFMISSAARAIRRGRGTPQGRATAEPAASPASVKAARADSVLSGPAGQRASDGAPKAGQRASASQPAAGEPGGMADHGAAAEYDQTEETDDYARAPGWPDGG
ncbi:MAG TPA: DUF6049 family protein [Streptosporangiaceae bacterium]|nr:DUF6049 family protein [Streptosporangiaceae bacterium]